MLFFGGFLPPAVLPDPGWKNNLTYFGSPIKKRCKFVPVFSGTEVPVFAMFKEYN